MEVEQGVHSRVYHQYHVAAAATVAPVGPSQRRVLLPVHRRTAMAAIARGDVNHHPIHEAGHLGFSSLQR
jgi:hypothetical protein